MNCASCNTTLTPMFEDRVRRYDDYPQYQDALIVELGGGYGMMIDPSWAIGMRGLRVVLCKDCGTKLLDENPYLAKIAERI